MAIETKVIKIRLYDEATTGRSITYSTQRVGTGDDTGLTSALATTAITPGSLVNDVYVRTDISATSTVPQEVKDVATMCWTETVYTAHESKLRS